MNRVYYNLKKKNNKSVSQRSYKIDKILAFPFFRFHEKTAGKKAITTSSTCSNHQIVIISMEPIKSTSPKSNSFFLLFEETQSSFWSEILLNFGIKNEKERERARAKAIQSLSHIMINIDIELEQCTYLNVINKFTPHTHTHSHTCVDDGCAHMSRVAVAIRHLIWLVARVRSAFIILFLLIAKAIGSTQ